MRIAVFTGGESFEREVAFWSAKNVVAELLRVGFDVKQFDIPSELPKFLEMKDQFSCVVPMLHGKGGEDGTIQGFLETLKMPYLFSGVAASAVAMDKFLAKTTISAQGIKTPEARVLSSGDVYEFEHPVVIKPIPCGSTLGVSVVKLSEELHAALALGFEYGDRLLAEDFIVGEEFTIGVIESGGDARALDVIQVISPSGLFTFEEKYIADKMAEEICPAEISEDLARRLQAAACLAHKALGVRHASRSDFMVDARGEIWFLETNTIPGMTAQSLITKALRVGGYDFGALLKSWIESVV